MGKIIRRILTIIPAVALQSLWLLLLMKWLTPYAPIIVSLLSVAAFFLVVFIIPDMSRIFVKIMPEKKLTKENYENLPRMIEETCVAEWTHILLSIAGLGLLKIWSGVGGVCITIIYIVLGNLPFIVVQRYNRPRLQKLFAMQQRKK